MVKIKNKYTIEGDIVRIYFHNKTHGDMSTIISKQSLDKVLKYNGSWFGSVRYRDKRVYMVSTKYLGLSDEGKPQYKTLYLHRFLTECCDGKLVVDHINGDRLDNRLENLKVTTQDENAKNRFKSNINNKTGVRNVSKNGNKYIVQFQIDGKNTVYGRFDNLNDAKKLADDLRDKLYI